MGRAIGGGQQLMTLGRGHHLPAHHWSSPDPHACAPAGRFPPLQAPGGPAFTPHVAPSAALLPAWNTMALFTVQPGRSFHAVQEVYAQERPRLSISGW